MKTSARTWWQRALLAGFLFLSLPLQAAWQPHEVRLLNGTNETIRIPAQFQMVTESWNRVAAVPYLAYLPEKDRLLLLVSCDYPHHAEVLFSDDHGSTWSPPKPALLGADGKPVPGLGTSLRYLGEGHVLFYGSARWFSHDYGQSWTDSVALATTPEGKPWYTWDPPWIDRDPHSGKILRIIETGYTWFKPPEVQTAHQQGYLRTSTDGGRTWTAAAKIPQWEAVSEVALVRAANGHLIAACRTDTPTRLLPEEIDHTEGLGVSISTDDGATWSAVRKLYDWGRHHPSMVLLPSGEIVMTYVVRKGYVDTPAGYPQFGIEAIVSRDHGQTWDLDHKYVLHQWVGHLPKGPNSWYPSSQATSTLRLPDGSLLTAFGTGYRCEDKVPGHPAPRDVGLIAWKLQEGNLSAAAKISAAPFDSEQRNVFDPREVLDTGAAIEKYRKGVLIIEAAPGTPVVVEQQRHAFWFGAALANQAFNGQMSGADRDQYLSVFLTNFNAAVTENALKWHSMEAQRGRVDYRTVESMLTWTEQHQIPLRGHNIYWGIPNRVQDWLKALPDDEFRQVLQERGLDVGRRFRGRFAEYDLNNEMIHGNYYEQRLGSGITKQMAEWVRQEDPKAVLYLNDYDILTGVRLQDYVTHIRGLLEQGVPLGGIGVQGHLHSESFDPAALHHALRQLSQFKLPIRVTEFNMPGQRSRYYENRQLKMTEAEEMEKARALTDYYRICFSYPRVEGILMWGFWEGANWIPVSSLYRRDWTPLPAAQAYRDLVFREWWTRWQGTTDALGRCEVPAFFGQHRIQAGSREQIIQLKKSEPRQVVSFR